MADVFDDDFEKQFDLAEVAQPKSATKLATDWYPDSWYPGGSGSAIDSVNWNTPLPVDTKVIGADGEVTPILDAIGDYVVKVPINIVNYLFNEGDYLKEAWNHIDGTYSSHYGGEIQPTEVIIDAGHGTGFNIGNIIKYAKRYGRKEGFNRKDLLKIIHYAIMQLYVHDKEGLGVVVNND